LAEKKNVYWDSCVWLTLIKEELGYEACEYVIDEAKKGNIQIWTSSLTLAEVYKFKCDGVSKELEQTKDAAFEDYISQDFVTEVQVDHDIGVRARRLCRFHQVLKKPNDGIHLASALRENLDEFHTTDRVDLLPLNGSILNDNGSAIKICKPPVKPVVPPASEFSLVPSEPVA
jgi:predicted nucleic acid-binding protein